MVTLWPRFWRPTAASMTSRSAPPMPRSGWKKIMRLGSGITACWIEISLWEKLRLGATGRFHVSSSCKTKHSKIDITIKSA